MNRQKLTAVKSIGLILIFLFSGCSSGSSAPEAELWGEWIVENIQSEKSDFAGSLIFHEDGRLVMDGQGQEDDIAQYVVIAPGRIKITRGGAAEVLNYEVSGEQLKLYFEEGYNQYARIRGASVAQSTREEISQTLPATTPTKKNFVEEIFENIISNGEVITPENAAEVIELRRLGKGIINDVAWTPDGSQVVVTSVGIYFYDAESLKERRFIESESLLTSVSFSPDGWVLAMGGWDGTVQLWDVSSREFRRPLEGHTETVTDVAFSPDGRMLASGSGDGTVRLWEVETGAALSTLEGHSSWIYSVAFSPDGRMLASGSWDETVRLWDVESGAALRTLEGHSSWVRSVAFSPDGRMLASGNGDFTVQLWDVEIGAALRTLEGHSDSVNSVAFSPDGRMLASGGLDETVRLWDVETGAALQILEGHRYSVGSVVFSPDGSTLASGGRDGTVRLWGVP